VKLYITSASVLALAPLFMFLTFRVIAYRRKNQISLSINKDSEILSRVRAHGNFVEYTPFFILVILLCELQQTNTILLRGFAAIFIIGRYLHATGILTGNLTLRAPGMILTLLAIFFSTVLLAGTLIS